MHSILTKKIFLVGVILTGFAFSGVAAQRASITPTQLTCEYLTAPTGLDVTSPRFSWRLRAADEKAYGQKQTAYRIRVSSALETSVRSIGDMWDSGWILSDETQLIAYAGKPLVSDQTYFWRVSVKDENGMESVSEEAAQWSTGLFEKDAWSARWIGADE